MAQLELFPQQEPILRQAQDERGKDAESTKQKPQPVKLHHWQLYVDGASRNNPGLSGAGVYLLKDGQPVVQKGFFLGTKTNNQAEYLALLLGIYFFKQQVSSGALFSIVSDSQLLIRQMEGVYKIKHPALKPLFMLAKQMLVGIKCDFGHVLREDNTEADKLANEGVDKKIAMPAPFVALLQENGISL